MQCLVTLTAACDEIQLKMKIGISANQQFISICDYTWKLGCSLTIFHHVLVLLFYALIL